MPRICLMFLAVCCGCFTARAAHADGGRLQVSRVVGPWRASVFTSPTPLTVGECDVSVLVENIRTQAIEQNVQIIVAAERDDIELIVAQPASHALATNKLLQAARLRLPSDGEWRFTVTIEQDDHHAQLDFRALVSAERAAWIDLAPWIVWPFAVMALFSWHQVLVTRSAKRRKTPS